MRNQKLLVMVFIAAIGGAALESTRADDNDMQKRARELLRQSMATNQPPASADASSSVAPMAPAAAVMTNAPAAEVPAPAVAMPTMESPAPAAMPAGTNAMPVVDQSLEEQLRATMRKAMAEQEKAAEDKPAKKAKYQSLPAEPATIQTQPAYPVYTAPAMKETPPLSAPTLQQVVPTAASNTEIGDVAASDTNTISPAVEMELREKMRRQMAEMEAKNKADLKAENSTYATIPQPAPPVLIPGSKEQKLADLLEQYKADQITPEQYHQKRAAIIAAP